MSKDNGAVVLTLPRTTKVRPGLKTVNPSPKIMNRRRSSLASSKDTIEQERSEKLMDLEYYVTI